MAPSISAISSIEPRHGSEPQKMIAPAYYQNRIISFLHANEDQILGELTSRHPFALDISQKNAWVEQISNLKQQLASFVDGEVFLEFTIPRMGKRVDVVLLIKGIVCVLEYKIGAKSHDKQAIDQVIDYSLDLKNFHEASHDKFIAPILIATRAERTANRVEWSRDKVLCPLISNGTDLAEVINAVRLGVPAQEPMDAETWAHSGYKPTPTIVEAAQALYRGHSVSEISRSDAGAINLTLTSDCICEIIDFSRRMRRKSICFVTGVPGSGKTLAGLNISVQKLSEKEEHAVFLSGNRPLVTVLREALTRDEVARNKADGRGGSKKDVGSKVSTFIQNVHHFRDEGIKSDRPPVEHVVVFDEAQRAWDQPHTEKFMTKKPFLEFDLCRSLFCVFGDEGICCLRQLVPSLLQSIGRQRFELHGQGSSGLCDELVQLVDLLVLCGDQLLASFAFRCNSLTCPITGGFCIFNCRCFLQYDLTNSR